MTPRRYMLIIFAYLSVLVVGTVYLLFLLGRAPEGREFSTLGTRWVVANPEWQETDGYWTVSSDIYFTGGHPRRPRLARDPYSAALLGICGAVLVSLLPNAPIKDRTKIGRVDVRVYVRALRILWFPVTQKRISVLVDEGQCSPEFRDRDQLFSSFARSIFGTKG